MLQKQPDAGALLHLARLSHLFNPQVETFQNAISIRLLLPAIMPIPHLPLHFHVDPPPSPSDGKISVDRLVLQQIEALISQHVPGMSVSFSSASVDVVCGGYTNK